MADTEQWSEWVDLKHEKIQDTPEEAGVFVIHSAMKILFIGDATNLRESLFEKSRDPCILENSRFKFMITPNHVKKREELIEDYKKRHEGNMPKCMN